MKAEWTKTDRILFGIVYGVMAGGILLHAISSIIEVCRSRPKVQMMVLGVPKGKDKGPDESSSAAE